MNCVSGMPEGSVTTRCMGIRKIYGDKRGREQSRERDETLCCSRHWPGLKGRKKSKFTRLANVESKYDPRRK